LLLAVVSVGSLLSALIGLTACSDESSRERTENTLNAPTIQPREPTELELPIRVAVTLPLFEDFVRAAGKENVEVVSVIPPSTDPHGYEPPADLVSGLSSLRFFFYNGLALDTDVADAIERGLEDETFVVPFAPNIRSPRGSELGDPEITAERAGDNPHLWLDPLLAYVYVEIVADEFVIYDGVRQKFYDDNFAAFRDEMVRLRDELSIGIEKIPQTRRKLVTYHNSFEHFARRFGLENSFAVAQPGSVPDSAAIETIVAAIRSSGIPAVFAEHGYDRGVTEDIASRAGVQVCTLYSDIFPDGVQTYAEMMRRNVAEIVRCLAEP
jgi:ABC-type Zn uptake system ZnuABC Zn-binding protein ZnuA